MPDALAAVVGTGALSLLALSGAVHGLLPGRLARAIQQNLASRAMLAWAMAIATAVVEVGIGGVGLAVVLAGVELGPDIKVIMGAATGLLLLFGCYSLLLVLRRAPTACGCSPFDHPASRVGVIRTLVAAVLAAGSVPYGENIADLHAHELWVAALAGLSLAIIAWILPDALEEPIPRPAGGPGGL
jgi:hypothetical protein